MIDLRHLTLNYGNQSVLNIDSFTINQPGLYAFVGPSGCGKTSLIHIITGAIQQYRGRVFIEGKDIKQFNEEERLIYRQNIISVCYQDYIVFDDLTVYENIALKLDFYPTLTATTKRFQITQIMHKLNLSHLKAKKAKYLSGGEKQRVAIARAIINQAKILIFDEPTAALDDRNAHTVFHYLQQLSKNHIVLVVTHNLELIRHYADEIIDLSYGRITKRTYYERKVKTTTTLTLTKSKLRQPSLLSSVKLGWKMFRSRQSRHAFASSTLTFCLTAICSLLVLTSTVSAGIKSSFAQNFNQNTAYISYKKKSPYPFIEGVTQQQASALAEKYNASLGTYYLNDIDTLFPHANKVFFSSPKGNYLLNDVCVTHFNYITLIEEVDPVSIFGYRKPQMLDDEIMLTLTPSDQRLLYEELGLRKGETLDRLGDYIRNNQVFINVYVRNDDWSYEDEQTFRLIGVRSGPVSQVIHSNLNFPQYLFEEQFLLPVSLQYSTIDAYPWTLKKMYFLYKKDNEKILINELWNPSILLARQGPTHFSTNQTIDLATDHRLMLTKKPPTYMNLKNLSDPSLAAPYYLITNYGLNVFEEALMIGFSDHFLVSRSRSQLEEMISYDERRFVNDNTNMLIAPQMSNGHISLSLSDGMTFDVAKKIAQGKEATSLEEIVLSTRLFNKLFGEHFDPTQKYSIAYATPREVIQKGNYLEKAYHIGELDITGVVEEVKEKIYHQSYWPLLFYKDVIKVDPYSIIPIGIITEDLHVILEFNRDTDYVISYPFKLFALTIDESLNQMVNIIYIGAIAALLMAMIVIFLSLKTLIDDFQPQLSLLYLFGYSHKTMLLVTLVSMGVIGLFSMINASLSTVIIEVIIAKTMFENIKVLQNMTAYLVTPLIGICCMIPAFIMLVIRLKSLKIVNLSKNNL